VKSSSKGIFVVSSFIFCYSGLRVSCPSEELPVQTPWLPDFRQINWKVFFVSQAPIFIPVSGTVCEPSKTAKSCSLKLEAISNGGKKSSALAIVWILAEYYCGERHLSFGHSKFSSNFQYHLHVYGYFSFFPPLISITVRNELHSWYVYIQSYFLALTWNGILLFFARKFFLQKYFNLRILPSIFTNSNKSTNQ
jgi:hypothetical protein